MTTWIVFSLSSIVAVVTVFTSLGVSTSGRVMVPPSADNCTGYNASAPCMVPGASLYCLTNGTTVTGYCDAHLAVCGEGATLASSLDPCTNTEQGNNTATSLQTTNYIVMSAVSAATICASHVLVP